MAKVPECTVIKTWGLKLSIISLTVLVSTSENGSAPDESC